MKICHAANFLPGFHKIWGGAEQACYLILELLTKNRQEVSVLSAEPIETPKEDFAFYSLPLLETFFGRGWPRSWLSFDPRVYRHSYRLLKKIKPDVLHLHNIDILSFALVLSAKRLGIPVLYSVYDYWCVCPNRILVDNNREICRRYQGFYCSVCVGYKKYAALFRKSFFNHIFNKIDAFIVLSEFAAGILQAYGIKREKIRVIYLPLFQEVDVQSDKVEDNTVLYVGWSLPHKGIDIALQAMSKVVEKIPQARMWIIETGKGDISGLIKRYGLERCVTLLGKLPHNSVKDYLQRCSVVVIPEQWENVGPLFLAEAMNFAKPVVASSIGAIPEFITDGESGCLVEPKDPGLFAERIIRLLKNRDVAIRMGMAAQESARRFFDKRSALERLLALYREKADKH